MESIPLGTCVIWSIYAGDLYIQVVFRAGFTVYTSVVLPSASPGSNGRLLASSLARLSGATPVCEGPTGKEFSDVPSNQWVKRT